VVCGCYCQGGTIRVLAWFLFSGVALVLAMWSVQWRATMTKNASSRTVHNRNGATDEDRTHSNILLCYHIFFKVVVLHTS
jgi:hypothetical protein